MALLRRLFLLALFPVAFAATGSWNGVSFTAWNGVAQTAWNGTTVSCASGGGGGGTPEISSDFSSAFGSPWIQIRPSPGSDTTGGTLNITNLHAVDGDWGVLNTNVTTYLNQYNEIKLSKLMTVAGDMGGFLARINTNITGTVSVDAPSGIWFAYNDPDQFFYIQRVRDGFWFDLIANTAGIIASNHYLGSEIIGPTSNFVCRFYDNGTSSKSWSNSWGAPIAEINGINANAGSAQKIGYWTGLWYGDGGARTKPAASFDDYRAGSFDSYGIDKFTRSTNNTSPVTFSHTCDATAKLLTLGISCANGSTVRAGGAPTYNGVTMTQAGTTQKAAASPEGSCELWYLISPGTGSSLTVSIPNTGSAPIYATASSWIPPAGVTPSLDVANGNNGTSTNPTLSLTNTVVGGLVVYIAFTGRDTAATATTGAINMNRTDDGAFGDSSFYTYVGYPRAVTATLTLASDDWAVCGASFK